MVFETGLCFGVDMVVFFLFSQHTAFMYHVYILATDVVSHTSIIGFGTLGVEGHEDCISEELVHGGFFGGECWS